MSHIDIIRINGWLTTSISLITRITTDCLLAWNSSTVCCSCGRKSSRFLLVTRCLTERSLRLHPSLGFMDFTEIWHCTSHVNSRQQSPQRRHFSHATHLVPFHSINLITFLKKGGQYFFLCRKVSARAWLMIKVRRKRVIHEERGGLQYLRNQFSRTLNIKNMATQLNTGTYEFACRQTSSCLVTNLIGVLKSRNIKHI